MSRKKVKKEDHRLKYVTVRFNESEYQVLKDYIDKNGLTSLSPFIRDSALKKANYNKAERKS